MSRVAKNPVAIPQGVEVMISDAEIAVKGPLGTLRQPLTGEVSVVREGDAVVCKAREGAENARAMSGAPFTIDDLAFDHGAALVRRLLAYGLVTPA